MSTDWFTECLDVEKEALYRAEIENFSERMVVNRQGRIIFINQKYAAKFGMTPEQLEGCLLDELLQRFNVPAVLDIPDFDRPFIRESDKLSPNPGGVHMLCRSPLLDNAGEKVGDIFYDAKDWLDRYQSLYTKLNELMLEYQCRQRESKGEILIGESAQIAQLKKEIAGAAQINSNLLIEGETGTGKEVVAMEVFRSSARSKANFVKLNCAAIPQELMESELFGYDDGAFTGARRGGHKGKFQQADKGTILLDEINSLPLPAQAKLLRVLQEREVVPVGGERTVKIDVRVIAISNKPLSEMVAQGTFREDLYYRLNVLHINVPPLRERRDDIPLLVRHFVRKYNREMDRHIDTIDRQVYEFLEQNEWPGNVRQLQNYIERAMTTAWKNTLTMPNFYWIEHPQPMQEAAPFPEIMLHSGATLAEMLDDTKRRIILKVLRRNRGNCSQTARDLGIARQNLYRAMKHLQIDPRCYIQGE